MSAPKTTVNIVWLKRDLRLRDHAPLAAAAADGKPVVLLYCFEPSLMAAPDSDERHWRFAYECVQDLREQLSTAGKALCVAVAEVLPTLAFLADQYAVGNLYCHEEVGNELSFRRDQAVARWCRERGIAYIEYPQNGVVRGLRHRAGWPEQLKQYFELAPVSTPWQALSTLPPPAAMPTGELPPALVRYQEGFQPGGERRAWRYWHSFLERRSAQYSRQLSKPEASRLHCSRLSPYLALGCISAREVMQSAYARAANEWNLNNFRARLGWRSHFMQKLESDWRIELHPINAAFLTLNRAEDGPLLDAWREGRTGFPMVDAAMRCLAATGWINFRMRAMLVSFASFALWLHWRPVALHLARLFLDYEPGIHYPQVQMQAALTGYNTLRIFNPAVQVQRHDPEGVFLRKWLPELAQLPNTHLAEPWKMTALEQGFYGCQIGADYPAPVVDYDQVIAANKNRYWAVRQSEEARRRLPAILAKLCVPADSGRHKTEQG